MTRLSKKLVAKISSSTSDKEDDEVFLLDRKISLAVEGFTTSGCELTLRDLDLGRIAAGCFAHAGINGVTRTGQSACSEGAKATRRACDENNVLHESLSTLYYIQQVR
jgi:hypothetical protein